MKTSHKHSGRLPREAVENILVPMKARSARPAAKTSAVKPAADGYSHLLFPLHAATEVDALWRAAQRLLHAAFAPCTRVTLFLGHFGMREARLVFTEPPIEHSTDWYRERGLTNPFTPYIREHRRITHYRFEDVVGTAKEFKKTEFYRRFAQAEGWDTGLSGVFWNGEEVKAMFSLYRAPGQRRFSEAEVARLLELRPHLETAIDRVQMLHAERLHRKVLEEFNRHIPIGLMLLDWELQPMFANSEAVRECAVWQHGPEVARGLVSRDWLELPVPIREACAVLREAILKANAKDKPAFDGRLERVVHPTLPGRVAAVSAVNASPGVLAKPGFLVVLEDRTQEHAAAAPVSAEKQRLLWVLSPCEREIALLICEGFSNEEIARRLKKSVLTTKKQTTSIYAKLNVPSRSRLMVLLR
jgi:DNA-binding CsgD family transcriptional regulator